MTGVQTCALPIYYDSKNLQKIQNSNNRFYNYDGLFKNDFYNMNIITLQINVICKNDNLKKILRYKRIII